MRGSYRGKMNCGDLRLFFFFFFVCGQIITVSEETCSNNHERSQNGEMPIRKQKFFKPTPDMFRFRFRNPPGPENGLSLRKISEENKNTCFFFLLLIFCVQNNDRTFFQNNSEINLKILLELVSGTKFN